MKEAELLQTLSKTYRIVNDNPELITSSMVKGLSKLTIRVFNAKDDPDMPIGSDKGIDYFVIDRGLATEEAYLDEHNMSVVGMAKDTIVATKAAAAIKG